MISVLLVDDHAIFLHTVCSIVTRASDMQVVAAVSSAEDAIAQAISHCPNVVVMDISMPAIDGIEATKRIYANCHSTRVLVLSGYDYAGYVQRALQAGAFGYVLKEDLASDLLTAIRAVHTGNRYFSKRVAGIAEQYTRQNRNESLPN